LIKRFLPLYLVVLIVLSLAFIYGCGSNATGGGGGGGGGGTILYTLTRSVTTEVPTTEVVGTIEVTPEASEYPSGTTVEITATALSSAYMFSSWEVDVTGETTPQDIIMNSSKNVVARFKIKPVGVSYALNIIISPEPGAGTVDQSGTSPYSAGDTVTLTADANTGYVFHKWKVNGVDQSTSTTTTVLMNGTKEVIAKFKHLYDLHVAVSPEGTGTIEPWGGTFTEGTVKILTAEANSGKQFVKWSGDISGTTNPYSLTMDGNKNVTAEFTYSISGTVHGGDTSKAAWFGAFLVNPLTTSGTPEPVTSEVIASGSTLNYILPGLIHGKYYYIFGIRDNMNAGFEHGPVTGDAVGAYPSVEGTLTSVEAGSTDINFNLTYTYGGGGGGTNGTISGHVSGGAGSKDVCLVAFTNSSFSGDPATYETFTAPGLGLDYTLHVPNGTYYVGGWRDSGGGISGPPSAGDIWGSYVSTSDVEPITVNGDNVTGKNFVFEYTIPGGGGGAGHSISGTVSGGDTSKNAWVAAFTENPLSPTSDASPVTSEVVSGATPSYTLVGLSSGTKYYIFGYRDQDSSGTQSPSTGDAAGAYPTFEAPASVEADSSGINFAFTHILTTAEVASHGGGGGYYSINGHVSGGNTDRNIGIAAFANSNFTGMVTSEIFVAPVDELDYTLHGLPPGTYYVGGFRDNDISGFDSGPTSGDLWGNYLNSSTVTPITIVDDNLYDKDFVFDYTIP